VVAEYWAYPTRGNTAPSNVLSTTGTNNANFVASMTKYAAPVNYLTPAGFFIASAGY
jgi:hypothetical protein